MTPEEIAAVLEAHAEVMSPSGGVVKCSCDRTTCWTRAHVAEVLAALLPVATEAQLITARDALAAIEAYAEAERVRANEAERAWGSERAGKLQFFRWWQAQANRRLDAQTELADLRAKVEALADEYGQYETDVWAEDVAHNLRALLDGA